MSDIESEMEPDESKCYKERRCKVQFEEPVSEEDVALNHSNHSDSYSSAEVSKDTNTAEKLQSVSKETVWYSFLGTKEIIFILKTSKQALFTIPPGKKENVYFILNNERNTEKRKQGKHSEFSDDCGAWSEGTSPKTVYEVKKW